MPTTMDTKTWAHTLMDGVRKVQELHQPVVHYYPPGGEDVSYTDLDEAVDEVLSNWNDDDISAPSREEVVASLDTFTVCKECSRIEHGAAAEVGYLESQWPCATSVALGIEGGALL